VIFACCSLIKAAEEKPNQGRLLDRIELKTTAINKATARIMMPSRKAG